MTQEMVLTIPPDSKMDNLARDLAILTANALYSPEEVAEAYDLTADMLAALRADPTFAERVEFHAKSISTDDNGLIRAQARLMAGSLLRDTFEIATDRQTKTADRLKATAAIMDLADVKPKQEQQFSGMVLNVSFGSGMPQVSIAPDDKGVIEHEQ